MLSSLVESVLSKPLFQQAWLDDDCVDDVLGEGVMRLYRRFNVAVYDAAHGHVVAIIKYISQRQNRQNRSFSKRNTNL